MRVTKKDTKSVIVDSGNESITIQISNAYSTVKIVRAARAICLPG
ncbi:MAG: hypothetical protein ACYS1A_17555 [Planctomycetota bacterium]